MSTLHHDTPAMKPHSPFSDFVAHLTDQNVRLRRENTELRDELKETKTKLHRSLYSQKSQHSDPKSKDRKQKRNSSEARNLEKRTQTEELFGSAGECKKLRSKCEKYKQKCVELEQIGRMLDASVTKTAAKLKAKSDELSTLKSKHENLLNRGNETLAIENEQLEQKFVKLGQECVVAEQKQQQILAAKESELEQIYDGNKRLSVLLCEKTVELDRLQMTPLAGMKQTAQTDEKVSRLTQVTKRLEKTNLQLAKEKTELTDKLKALMEIISDSRANKRPGTNESVSSLIERKKELEFQCEHLKERNATLEGRIQQINQESGSPGQKDALIQTQELHNVCSRCPELERNVSEMHDSVCRATNQLAQLQNTNASVVTENDLLRKKLKEQYRSKAVQ